MIYAKITPKIMGLHFPTLRKPRNHYDIYELIRFLIRDKYSQSECHKIADNAACWCELACIGETFEHKLFTIEIIDI